MKEDSIESHTTRNAFLRRLFQVRICKDNGRSFSSQFHQDWLEVLPAELSDDSAYCRTSDEFNFPDGWMRNQSLGNRSSILTTGLDDVDHTIGQASLLEDFNQQTVSFRASL